MNSSKASPFSQTRRTFLRNAAATAVAASFGNSLLDKLALEVVPFFRQFGGKFKVGLCHS